MPFFEIPSWCMKNEDIQDYSTCDSNMYPNSGLPKMNYLLSGFLEILWLGILVFFTCLRKTFKIPTCRSTIREIVHLALSLIATVDIISSMILFRPPICSKFIRLIIFIIFVRSIRECLYRIVMVVYDSKEILLLMIGYVFFFSWIGVMLFKGSVEGEKYFPCLYNAVFNLLVLLSTANFPDIMLPAYKSDRIYCLFFIVYLIIGVFFLMSLVCAIFYSNFKNRVEQQLNSFIEQRRNYLISKFAEHDTEGKGYLSPNELKNLIQEFVKFNNKSKPCDLNIRRISAIFDKNLDGKITRDDFVNNFDQCELKDICVSECIKAIENSNNHGNKWTKIIQCLLKHPFYEGTICVFIILNFLSSIQEDWIDAYGMNKEMIMYWIYIQLSANIFYLIELIVSCYVFTTFPIFRIEFYIQIANFIYLFKYLAFGHLDAEIRAIEISTIVRTIRLIYLLQEVRHFKVVIQTIQALVKPFYVLLLVFYTCFLLFAFIGDLLFGGIGNMTTKEIFRDQSVPDIYVVLNFNDLGSSIVTLFTLMVVSNCYVTEQIYINTTSRYAKFYFSLFNFCCGTVLLNIIIAFVIDMHQCVEKINRKENDKQIYENEKNSYTEDEKVNEEKEEIKESAAISQTEFKPPNSKILRNDVENILDIDLIKDSYVEPKFIKNVSFGQVDHYISHSNQFKKEGSNKIKDSEKSGENDAHSPKFGAKHKKLCDTDLFEGDNKFKENDEINYIELVAMENSQNELDQEQSYEDNKNK